MPKLSQFKAPALVVHGEGAVKSELGTLAKGCGKSALIVTDSNLEKLGLLDDIKSGLSGVGIPFAVYNKVVTEPSMAYAQEGMQRFTEAGADFLIAVGGGSPIDAAKAISVLAGNGGKMSDYEGPNRIPKPGAPLIAIPTTAGTGSEVTQFTIITDTDRNVKMLIASPRIIPRIAIVDPLMTMTLPQAITAATGIDALTHAIEAYVSVKAHAISDALALHAIGLVAAHLRQAWCNPDSLEARVGMSTAALEAGLAFSNASVALVHGMARPIGAYFHIGHGLSNAVLLPTVVEFSIPGNVKRYADIAAALGEQIEGLSLLDAATQAAKALTRLNEDLRVPSLRGLGIDQKALEGVVEQMAKDALASGSPGNNPRKATKDEIVELYRKAY